MADRYIISWIPAKDVETFALKHAEKIAAGYSIWDIQPPEYFEKRITITGVTEAIALAQAKRLVPHDDAGEVHVMHEHAPHADSPSWKWETVARAVVDERSESFDWLTECSA